MRLGGVGNPPPFFLTMDNTLLLYRILSGKIRFTIDGEECYYIYPPFDILATAQEKYLEAYNDAVLMDLLTDKDVLLLLMENNLWTLVEQEEYDKFEDNLSNLQVELYQTHVRFGNKDIIRKRIELLKKRQLELTKKRNEFYSFTAEYAAKTVREKYLVWAGSYRENAEKLFTTPFKQTDDSLLTYIRNHLYDSPSGDTIREIAKSNAWRNIWSVYKTTNTQFLQVNTTPDQITLISWTKFYDWVYETPDSPPDAVIQDDDLLDGWALLRKRKMEKDKKTQEIEENNKLANANEVFIVAENQEEARRITELNDTYGNMARRQKLNLAEKHGEVREQDMPEARREIMQKAMEMEHQQIRSQ